MATETINIRIREDGSRVVKRNLEDVGNTAEKAASGVDILKRALGALAAFIAVDQIRKYADAWASASGQIRIATKDIAEAAAVQEQLYKTAQNTRQGFTDIVELYSRTARSGKELGASQAQLIKFTENVGKTLAASSTSAQQAQGALMQMGQALGSGIVRAEEFNSILEGAPAILQVVANHIDGAEGSIGKLRKMMLDGKLTSKAFFDAMLAGSEEIDAKFGKASFTISQGFTLISNAFMRWIGQTDSALGISNTLGQAMKWIADNLNVMADALVRMTGTIITATAAYLAFQGTMKAGFIIDAVKSFLDLRQAIASGNVVMLGSAEAARQKAVADLESATANRAATIAAIAKADADGAGIIMTTRASVANATAAADRIRWTQAQLVAERELEIVRMRAQISDIGRMQSATRLAEVRRAEVALAKSLATAEAELASAKSAAATASSAQATRAAQQSAQLAQATQAVATAQTAVTASTAAAAGSTSLFAQALNGLKNVFSALASRVIALFAIINAHPFVALATAITATVGALVVWGDKLNAGIDDLTTMRDVGVATWEQIQEGLIYLYESVGEVFSGIGSAAINSLTAITGFTSEQIKVWLAQYTSFYDGVGSGFAGVAKGIARTIDAIAGLLTGLGIAVVRAFAGVPDAIKEMFNRTYNAVVGVVENLVNTVINGVNKMRSAVGMDLLETVKFDRKQVDTKFFETYGQNIAQSIDDGFQQQGGFMEKWVDGVFTRAQAIGKQRAAALGNQTGVDLNQAMGTFKAPGPDEKELEKQRKELEKLKNELRSLLNTIAPVEGAKLEMAKAEETLNKAVAKGLITTQDQARYLELLKFHYQDIIDPLGKVNREMDEQIRLLGMSSRARQVESEYMKIEKDLRSQGITLTQEETAALRSKIEMLQRQNELVAAQDQMLANSVEQRRAFNTQIEAMNNLLANPSSGFTAGDAQGQVMGMLGGMGIDTAGMQGQMQAQLELIQTYYAQLDMLRQNDLISEQDYSNAKVQLAQRENELKTQNMRNFFSGLASLQSSNIKELAAIGKAAAITQAIMNTYEGATKALAQGGIYGAAMAAVVVAQGMAQVAAIRSQQTQGFMTGGNFTVGGTGGADSQMVAFRATPGEQVQVSTPTQVRKGTAAQGQGEQAAQPAVVTPKIINVLDPAIVGDYLGTDEGEQLIMNVVQRNQRALGY